LGGGGGGGWSWGFSSRGGIGTGFLPELSARQHLLNGAILGMTRREVARSSTPIVGLRREHRSGYAVKRYSAMYTRLAFAVAIALETEVAHGGRWSWRSGTRLFRQSCARENGRGEPQRAHRPLRPQQTLSAHQARATRDADRIRRGRAGRQTWEGVVNRHLTAAPTCRAPGSSRRTRPACRRGTKRGAVRPSDRLGRSEPNTAYFGSLPIGVTLDALKTIGTPHRDAFSCATAHVTYSTSMGRRPHRCGARRHLRQWGRIA